MNLTQIDLQLTSVDENEMNLLTELMNILLGN